MIGKGIIDKKGGFVKQMITIERLIKKAKSLPTTSGCYIMKNIQGDSEQIIYIGKAKNLRSRVSSYFQKGVKDLKTDLLVKHINDFEFISTENETEAFVLENNLIKKHTPKYNIRLKDDKSYPYIIVDYNEAYPRSVYTRRIPRKKNISIYGPFVMGSHISEVLKILIKSFQLRDCSLREFNSRKTPCILYQMKQCSAPCVNLISHEKYMRDLKLALLVLEGNERDALVFLEKEMQRYSLEEKFELASIVRDNLEALKDFCKIGKQQNVELKDTSKNIDVIGYYLGKEEVEISIYMIRSGLLLGHKTFNFYLKDLKESFEEELLSFLYRYYEQAKGVFPNIIVTDFSKDKNEFFKAVLQDLKLSKLEVRNPGRKYKSLFELTKKHSFEEQKTRLKSFGSTYHGLMKLAELLKLKERPIVLECYDIAVFAGSSPTASQIVYYNGLPDKKSYRHYKLEERPEGNNDFAMMKEVLTRRIPHGKLPDIFIVDGGKQQVNIFLGVLKDFDLTIPVVGIAKPDERLIIPGRSNPYFLCKNMSLFQIITSMRDEAHRFSRRLHHKLESKRIVGSKVDEIPGIGPVTRKKILKNLTMPLKDLAHLPEDEICKILGIKQNYALIIKKFFSSVNE